MIRYRYRVEGQDDFDYTEYVVGEYDTYEEAYKVMIDKEEEHSHYQDMGMRDRMRIVKVARGGEESSESKTTPV
jgi:hypothetical protein